MTYAVISSKSTKKSVAQVWFDNLYINLYNCKYLINYEGSGVTREELVWGVIMEMQEHRSCGFCAVKHPEGVLDVILERDVIDPHFFPNFLTREVWRCWETPQ